MWPTLMGPMWKELAVRSVLKHVTVRVPRIGLPEEEGDEVRQGIAVAIGVELPFPSRMTRLGDKYTPCAPID